MRHRVADAFRTYDIEPTESLLALIECCWGIVLLNPWVNTFGTTSGFSVLRELPISENVWGIVMLFLGLTTMTGLVLTHRYARQGVRIRRVAVTGALFVWIFIAAAFIKSNPASTATATYPLIALAVWWLAYRLERRMRRAH